MQQFILPVDPRQGVGSSKCGVLRRQGLLPGIIYGAAAESIAVSVNKNEFIKLARKATSSQLFTLKSSDKNLDGRITIVKDIQKDPLGSADPLHLDLMAIREDEELTLDVPLKIVGEPVGVKLSGGVLSVAVHEITISCLPKFIPDRISLDVSGVELDQSLHAKDIQLPEGVSLATDPEDTIVSVIEIRTVEEAPVAAAPAEGAVPAEGAATAEAAADDKGGEKE